MFSRAWATIRSLVFPYDFSPSCRARPQSRIPNHRQLEVERSPPRKRPKHATSPEVDHLPHLSPLEAVNVDVFRLIADELQYQGGSLHNLSLCSRKLRYLSLPILFSRCKWMILCHSYRPAAEPPEAIRPFVRYLNVYWGFQSDHDVEQFRTVLGCFPSVSSVTFIGDQGTIFWPVIRSCIVNPRITSLSFDPRFTVRFHYPPELSDDTVTSSLERLSLTTTMWREHAHMTPQTRSRYPTVQRDIKEIYRVERECLTAILLTMNNTATSVTIPLESAPLREMSTIPWPRLRHLSLRGRFLDGAQPTALQVLLPSLPSLETLLVQAARSKQVGRARLLAPLDSSGRVHGACSSTAPSHNPPTASGSSSVVVKQPPTPPAILPRLRSLTIAYPNPEDAIFSINVELTQLSLTDCPRFYNLFAYRGEFFGPQWGWNAPILNTAQCLSIMRRMSLSRLTRLELVYMVPAAQLGNDSDLLAYIGGAFPALSHLEIHRYRHRRVEQVNHIAIARLLAVSKSLRTVRLNLDFHDDHGAYCGNPEKRERWHDTFMHQRGPEILAIMQECPLLEHVALLYHGRPSATWVEFRTARCPGPRVVLDYDPEHVDSEPIRKSWRTT